MARSEGKVAAIILMVDKIDTLHNPKPITLLYAVTRDDAELIQIIY
jgi:hypothetical protein